MTITVWLSAWRSLLDKFAGRIRCLLPSRLPVGVTEFHCWADSIVRVYGLPDNESSRFALAGMIMHAGPQAFYRAKEFYGRSALKSMSNQIAYQVMQDLKAKQAAEQEAETKRLKDLEEENKLAAATAIPTVESHEPLQDQEIRSA